MEVLHIYFTAKDRAISKPPHHTTVCSFRHRPIRHFVCPLYMDWSVFVVNSTPCLYARSTNDPSVVGGSLQRPSCTLLAGGEQWWM